MTPVVTIDTKGNGVHNPFGCVVREILQPALAQFVYLISGYPFQLLVGDTSGEYLIRRVVDLRRHYDTYVGVFFESSFDVAHRFGRLELEQLVC